MKLEGQYMGLRSQSESDNHKIQFPEGEYRI